MLKPCHIAKLKSILWPATCIICGLNVNTIEGYICSFCYQHFPWLYGVCYQCGSSHSQLTEMSNESNINSAGYQYIRKTNDFSGRLQTESPGVHTKCITGMSESSQQLRTFIREGYICAACTDIPPDFDRFCGLFFYRQPLIRMVSQLKFSRNLEIAAAFGELLTKNLAIWYPHAESFPDAIIPVPLHNKRLSWRGFNQALEIAKHVAKHYYYVSETVDINTNRTIIKNISNSGNALLNNLCSNRRIIVDTKLIIKIKNSTPQVNLAKKQRLKNLKYAFKVTKKSPYTHIAILDDVFTTGSTISAISSKLKQAGVEQIDVWCICRA